MVLAGYENHCRDSARCIFCPVDLLSDAGDRVDAGNIIGSAVNNPNNAHLNRASVSEVMDMAGQSAEMLQRPELKGVALGALVITATGTCKVD